MGEKNYMGISNNKLTKSDIRKCGHGYEKKP